MVPAKLSKENRMVLDLNNIIHGNTNMYNYHINHINIARRYAILINNKMGNLVDNRKLEYAALFHDTFKERSLDETSGSVSWKNYNIPQDTNRYVRLNLDVLEEYGLDEFFNTDVQLHALTAGIFLRKEFKIKDREILYPVMFHSCPIISVYETLSEKEKLMVDIMMLSDKLSSNYLRINMRESEVRVDLDQIVFGSNGKEFNYTLGLYIARLISQGKSKEEQSSIATEYYFKRLSESNPLIQEKYSLKDLGGAKVWPKRKNRMWMMQSNSSEM